MLEHSFLLVHGWSRVDDSPGAWARAVTNDGGRRLGFVRFEGDPLASWFSWLRKARLDVFETEDASHLMSLTRAWGVLRAWDVHDAEERHVGRINPKTMMTGERVRLGFLDFESADQGRILDQTGQVLAQYGRKGALVEVTFTPGSSANPFLRMLILGSILTLEPAPSEPRTK